PSRHRVPRAPRRERRASRARFNPPCTFPLSGVLHPAPPEVHGGEARDREADDGAAADQAVAADQVGRYGLIGGGAVVGLAIAGFAAMHLWRRRMEDA